MVNPALRIKATARAMACPGFRFTAAQTPALPRIPGDPPVEATASAEAQHDVAFEAKKSLFDKSRVCGNREL